MDIKAALGVVGITYGILAGVLEGHDLIIIRHGESDHNINHIHNSNPVHPNYRISNLTASGRQRVEQTAQELMEKGYNDSNIVAVFVSPLPRTQQTADILASQGLFSKDKIKLDPRLIENQTGDLEGTRVEKGYMMDIEKHGGETMSQVEKRVTDFYQMVVTEYPEGNILVVTHKTPGDRLAKIAGYSAHLKTGEAFVLPLPKEEMSIQSH